jgi:hypothetical protein
MRPGRGLVGSLLVLLAAWLIARERLDAVVVRGRSMAPTLRPGDRLLILRLSRPPRVGEVVLAPDPRDDGRELVKRVVAAGALGVTLHGDNPALSADARRFGSVPAADVRWRAVLRYWPADRIGPIPSRKPVEEGGGEPPGAVPDELVAGE